MATPINRSSSTPVDLLQVVSGDDKARPLLQRLQQLGSFQAQVVLAQGRQILLDTAFGQVRGELAQMARGTTPALQPGDRIEASLNQGEGPPRLRIRSHQPLQITLRQPGLYQRLQQLDQPLLAARVSGQGELHNLLQVGRESVQIPRQESLRTGDTLLLRPGPSTGQVVATRIQPLPLLRQALSQLLPQQAAALSGHGDGSEYSLSRLQQLARVLLAATGSGTRAAETAQSPTPGRPVTTPGPQVPGTPPAQRTDTAVETGTRSPAPQSGNLPPPTASRSARPAEPPLVQGTHAQPESPAKTAEARAPGPAHGARVSQTPVNGAEPAVTPPRSDGPAPSRLQALLEPLMRLAIDPARVNPQQVQRALSSLGLAPPVASPGPPASGGELLPRLIELHSLLRDQPEWFDRLLRGATAAQHTAAADATLTDEPAFWRQQFSQQLEQGINQLLLGKTGVRLQQEQQQPLNMNLVVPLQLPNDTQRELKLKLRERSNPDNPEQPAWELRLSFEFGLLGLITVHVLLQEQRISAHFWAAEEPTWRLIDDQLPQFRRQLLSSGFEPGLFDCFHGQPNIEDDPVTPTAGDNLVDLQA